jgi:hypothetical protein
MGESVVDWWSLSGKPANALVLRTIDAEGYFKLIFGRLLSSEGWSGARVSLGWAHGLARKAIRKRIREAGRTTGQMKQANLQPGKFHGEWNYVIKPHRMH